MVKLLTTGMVLVGFSSFLYASPYSRDRSRVTERVSEPFSYELFLADVDCWITQKCSGLVEDNANRSLSKRLTSLIRSTQSSLDTAIFGLRNQAWFPNSLAFLQRKDVKVRAVIDQMKGVWGDWDVPEHFVYPDARLIVKAIGEKNIRVDQNSDGSVRTSSLMHHKFFIQDQSQTWFGSTNVSDSETGSEYNANSSILVKSKTIADYFQKEFNQMFDDGNFSIHKIQTHLPPVIEFADGSVVSIMFSPQDAPVTNGVIPFIDGAQRSLDIAIFFLTDKRVADALILAHKRGVIVRIINDATGASNSYAKNKQLRAAGIDARVENWGGKMHMKTAIRDRKDSLIGSVNWTSAGDRENDEHLVIIENNRSLAMQLTQYFNSLWKTLPSSLVPGYMEPRPEGPESINSCQDGINNDHNGGVDQTATECQ